jgi:hypothetical protein
MTDVIQVAVIMSIPGTLGVALSYYNGVLARRTERHTQATRDAMILLEKNTNSIKDALVATTKRESFAAGKKDEKDRTDEIAAAVKEATLPRVVSRQERDSKL